LRFDFSSRSKTSLRTSTLKHQTSGKGGELDVA
jgi:hypothetical protein